MSPTTVNLHPGFPVWTPLHGDPLPHLMIRPLHGFLKTSSAVLRRHSEAGA